MPRKATKKSARKTRRRHRGGFYGATGAIAPGAMQWSRGSEMGDYAISDRGRNTSTQIGARRRRKTRRRHRGGQKFGAVYASYPGTGARGIADYVAGTHKPGIAALGDFNDYSAKPGDFRQFMKAGTY